MVEVGLQFPKLVAAGADQRWNHFIERAHNITTYSIQLLTEKANVQIHINNKFCKS